MNKTKDMCLEDYVGQLSENHFARKEYEEMKKQIKGFKKESLEDFVYAFCKTALKFDEGDRKGRRPISL